MADKNSIKLISQNKKAYHDYFIEDTYECGISLAGTEVKSIRNGQINLRDSFASVQSGEVIVIGMHISPYEKGNIFNRDPVRVRRLLMHKREINKLNAEVMQQGVALIPISLYLKDSKVKMELGVCKGKKLYDKREASAKKDAQRDMDRIMKERNQ